MFRLADFKEGTPLYKYISAISSQTILTALEDLFSSTPPPVEDFYQNTFSEDVLGTDFFEGLSRYIKERAAVTADDFGEPYTPDGKAGMELIRRKVSRMKEKMKDPDHYYTFDLFEEYLFHLLIEFHIMIFVEDDQREDEEKERLSAAIRQTTRELIEKYDVDEEEAVSIAESALKIEKMGLDDSDTYFWDDDYEIVFEHGFVNGIRGLVSGSAAMFGYGYDDVCSIFNDVGIKPPLLLVGTEEAFNVVGDVAEEKMREMMKNIPVPPIPDAFKDIPDDEDDLPFS